MIIAACRIGFLAFAILVPGITSAQRVFHPTTHWQVVRNGDTLLNPWTGGHVNPQFSHVDLDNDGVQDLFVFDRTDRSITTYRANGYLSNNLTRWQHLYDYQSTFLHDSLGAWALLRDFDGDGDADLLTDRNSNVAVYRNTQEQNGQLQFENYLPRIYTLYSGFRAFLYAAGSDISGFEDVDYDGDMDVLVYDVNGTQVELHRNLAMEVLGRADTIVCQMVTPCYGRFFENYVINTNRFEVDVNRPACIGELKTNQGNHSGGTLLPINLNGDTLMDLVVGDIDVRYMVSVTNGGIRRKAIMVAADTVFPSSTRRVNIPYMPAGFYVDMDQDGIRDLLIAPNQELTSADDSVIWLYKNNGFDTQPDFQFYSYNQFTSEELDIGKNAAPCWFDENGDGKPDLLIGNRSRMGLAENPKASISLYRNVGTLTQPSFQWITDDYLFLGTTQGTSTFRGYTPAAGDVDNDGRIDLLIGEENGRILYYRNIAPPGQAAQMRLVTTDFLGFLSTGQRRPVPAIVDVDQDGKSDLIIGTQRGRLWFYRSTIQDGALNFQRVSSRWGGVEVTDPLLDNFSGNAHPTVADVTGDGRPDLLVGSLRGQVYVYSGLRADSTTQFPLIDSLLPQRNGWNIRPAVVRIPGRDSLLVALGTARGGILAGYYAVPPDTATDTNHTAILPASPGALLNAYPNPSKGQIWVEVPGEGHLAWIDALGRQLQSWPVAAAGKVLLELNANASAGVYLLTWQSANGSNRRNCRIQLLDSSR